MLTGLQYRVLKWISPLGGPDEPEVSAFDGKSKVGVQLGEQILERIRGKTVIDFGCGCGLEAIDLARHGARKVIGLDIRREVLEEARRNASQAGCSGVCEFTTAAREKADIIISLDAFEHFQYPAAVLRYMEELLLPEGEVLASFGPTWYHPLGGHLFSIFPWAHLLVSEKALIQWRSDFKTDGATRFSEVAGGLNQMTIRRFEKIVESSPLRLAKLETMPIRRLRPLHNRWTREFTTAVVRCRLVKRRG